MPKSKPAPVVFDLTSPEFVKQFKKAAKAFTRRATRSKEAALKVLVDEGICTPTGRLTKNYC